MTMTVFSDMNTTLLHNPDLRIGATFRNNTIYGYFSDETYEQDGVRTRIISFELVNADIDQAPEAKEKITIDNVTYEIIDPVEDKDCASWILNLRRT
jgi:hypothetical protein